MSRLPSLSEYDHSPDASPQARAERGAAHGGVLPFSLPVIAGPGCWCGEPMGHPWEAKAEGAPHPRGQRDGGAR